MILISDIEPPVGSGSELFQSPTTGADVEFPTDAAVALPSLFNPRFILWCSSDRLI
jgi:hypothetical protein